VAVLSEKTLMPLTFVVTLAGVVFWASNIAARVEAQSSRIVQLEERDVKILEMREDVARISARVDMIYDRVKASRR
jgi:hypothetical protein